VTPQDGAAALSELDRHHQLDQSRHRRLGVAHVGLQDTNDVGRREVAAVETRKIDVTGQTELHQPAQLVVVHVAEVQLRVIDPAGAEQSGVDHVGVVGRHDLDQPVRR
jgi:hypothetical protein